MKTKTSKGTGPTVQKIAPKPITMYESETNELSRLTGLHHTAAERIAWDVFKETTIRRRLATDFPLADAQECLMAVYKFQEAVIELRSLQPKADA